MSLIGQASLDVIRSEVKKTSTLPGLMAELGVYNGGSALVICKASAEHNKEIHLFDTFTGLPADDEIGTLQKGFLQGSLEITQRRLAGRNVVYHIGFFPETTKELPEDASFCFVHLDADLYRSTLDGINYFWPRMVSGGVIVFDDYCLDQCPGVKKALFETVGKEAIIVTTNCQCKIVKSQSLPVQ